MSNTELDTIVATLLTPLSGSEPAGRWMRYERAYNEISKAREEDDPSLPMGEWERPQIRADWRGVAASCRQLLAEDSKDFQVAAWLCEAWIRLYRLDGLQAGLDLISGMLEQYWQNGWPAIEDGDTDRRIAPFVWLNVTLPLTLKQHIQILSAGNLREQALTLIDWEAAPLTESQDNDDDTDTDDKPVMSRAGLRASVRTAEAPALLTVLTQTELALQKILLLSDRLDALMPVDSPSLSRLRAVLESILAAAQSLYREVERKMPAAVLTAGADNVLPVYADLEDDAVSQTSSPALAGKLSSREQAYRQLEAAADYLQAIEPHSPTPYLVKRAVRWGQMSLPELIEEAGTEEGALERFFLMLGISPLS